MMTIFNFSSGVSLLKLEQHLLYFLPPRLVSLSAQRIAKWARLCLSDGHHPTGKELTGNYFGKFEDKLYFK
jgi:hypothetical protein